MGLAICEALRAMSGNDPARKVPAVSRLIQLVEKTPLEPLGAGERANARQRAVAARQIPLWLVARACWNQKNDKDAAKLAELVAPRALEAARRQTDNTFYLAMIREQGELALAQGDRAGAVAAWGRMLDIVVSPPQNKAKKAGQAPKRLGIPGARRRRLPRRRCRERMRLSRFVAARWSSWFRIRVRLRQREKLRRPELAQPRASSPVVLVNRLSRSARGRRPAQPGATGKATAPRALRRAALDRT